VSSDVPSDDISMLANIVVGAVKRRGRGKKRKRRMD